MRIAIVHDLQKNIPHAILIVYTDDGVKFLDNQYKSVKDADGFTRYRPIYSINRTGWWRHAGLNDLAALIKAVTASTLTFLAVVFFLGQPAALKREAG